MALKKEKRERDKPLWARQLTAVRTLTGRSQTDIAKDLGISQQGYSLYEKGEREPDIQMLVRIRSVYNISIDWLLTGTGAHSLPSGAESHPQTNPRRPSLQ